MSQAKSCNIIVWTCKTTQTKKLRSEENLTLYTENERYRFKQMSGGSSELKVKLASLKQQFLMLANVLFRP